jgi:hypothetical protein
MIPKKLGEPRVINLTTMNRALMVKNIWHWLSKKI